MLQLFPKGSMGEAKELLGEVERRAADQLRSLADKISKHFLWEGLGISLVVDQWGFAKKLLEFETDDVVWDANEEGAAERWDEIMQKCMVATAEECQRAREQSAAERRNNKMQVADASPLGLSPRAPRPHTGEEAGQASRRPSGASSQEGLRQRGVAAWG